MISLKSKREILNWLLDDRVYESCLEISNGKEQHPVDSDSEEDTPDTLLPDRNFYDMAIYARSEDFFEKNTSTFDLIAVHGVCEETLYQDIVRASRILNKGGTIVCSNIVPRAGTDCWRGWLRFREDYPGVAACVVDIDDGVGVIFPTGEHVSRAWKGTAATIHVEQFRSHENEWLPLISAIHLPRFFGDSALVGYTDVLEKGRTTIVTLWRPQWGDAQEEVLEWINHEPLPSNTKFIWGVEVGSDADRKLSQAAAVLKQRNPTFGIEFMDYDPEPVTSNTKKHAWISRLYTEAMRTVATEFTFFLEDDTVPPIDGFQKLGAFMGKQDPDTACIGAAYRSRGRPSGICARLSESWEELDDLDELTPVTWIGGGFTLYRTIELQKSLPYYCIVWGRRIKGWDIVLSEELDARCKKQLLATRLRAAHKCDKVIQYCNDRGLSIS